MTESPLSPRHGASAFWTGSEVLIVGGNAGVPPCLGECFSADGPLLRDGAAYAPGPRTWRRLASAPVDLRYVSGAILDGSLYVWSMDPMHPENGTGTFLRHHITDDRWEELPGPRGIAPGLRLVAAGRQIVAYAGSQEDGIVPDQLFDPERGSWSDLPLDPLAPAFDRSVVWTGRELVVIGLRLDPTYSTDGPRVYSAAFLESDGARWSRLPESSISGRSPTWAWAGDRIVNPTPGGLDGGQNQWGRVVPVGGTLSPATWSWGPIPDLPPGQTAYSNWSGYRGLSVAGSSHLVDSNGWVLEAAAGRWIPLDKPPSPAAEGEAAVWAGDRLMVWGGIGSTLDGLRLINSGWTWVP